MIIGVPTERELESAGVDYLYLAVSEAIEIAQGEQYFNLPSSEDETEAEWSTTSLVQEYWTSVRRKVALAASLVQLGAELLLKARIAEVSPYLLLDRASPLPSKAATSDVHFDELRTVDAHALPRLYNAVCGNHLSDSFTTTLASLRQRRNSIMHTASERTVPRCTSIITDALEVSHNLVGEGSWPAIHRAQVSAPPFSRIDYHDAIPAQLVGDFDYLLTCLSESEAKRYLGMSKRQRRYFCPGCRHGDFAPDIKIATLQPNSASSSTIFCVACGQDYQVLRSRCGSCPGNVLDEEMSCLTCGAHPTDRSVEDSLSEWERALGGRKAKKDPGGDS